jgi:hypothetical protein
MRDELRARLRAAWSLLFPREILSRRVFTVWVVVYAAYAVLLLAGTGAGLLRLFTSPNVAMLEKIVALMLAPPVVVVFGLGVGAMLLTVALSVWVDICVRWANGIGSQHESE